MSLPRSTPSAQGVDAAGLRDFVVALENEGLAPHSFMLARHGQVVAEGWWHPYAADRPALVYSLSKTVTATAVGLLVDEGRLSLDAPVLEFFPEIDRGEVAPLWGEVLVKHCLSMTVGHEVDAWQEVARRGRSTWSGAPGSEAVAGDDGVRHVFATTPTARPGTLFTYNQVATYLLSRIVARVTGSGVVDVLKGRLLSDLGVDDIPWDRDPQGHELGFSGAHLTTEAILTLAQLYLGGGVLGDRRVLSKQWCDEATTRFGPTDLRPGVNPDWARGYGFSFWMQQVGYRGDGAYGQFLVVLPEHDVALAVTSEHENMQATLDLVWRHLLPAFDRSGSSAADAELVELLAARRIEPLTDGSAAGEDVSLERASGSDLSRRYTGASVRRDGSSWVLDLRRDEQVMAVRVGSGEWAASTLRSDGYELPVVASGGWRDADTFVADVIVIETPHRFHVEGRRSTGEVGLRWRLMPLNGPDPLDLAVRRSD
ncbi:serine hydrolase [Humibacillus sp. DSM 29435]|uniref:serine hydrolase domain-containing protein n=1 Tax=Humibacillus sp. DSM 29435 TaxID=1869167 RepID=UPI0009F3FDF3|nr:serine hydrolase domain-containing protein [Humibacillus sp. DSM 29435]